MLNPIGHRFTILSERDWSKNRRLLPNTSDTWKLALFSGQTTMSPPLSDFVDGGIFSDPTYCTVDYHFTDHRTNPVSFSLSTTFFYSNYGVDINRNMPTPGWGYLPEKAPDNGKPTDGSYFGTSLASEDEAKALIAFLTNVQVDAAIDYHSYNDFIIYPDEVPQNADLIQLDTSKNLAV